MNEEVIVVGSGVAGSTAALILAAAGKEVLVLEAAPKSAPLIRGFRRCGLLCETGFHYSGGLCRGGLLDLLFGRFGLMQHLEPVSLPQDGFDLLHWKDIEITISTGFDSAARLLREAFPASVKAVDQYFDVVKRALEETPFLNPLIPPWKTRRAPEDGVPLDSFLRKSGAEQELIDLLGCYGQFLYGMDASEASVRLNAMVLGSYFRSAHTVIGGGESIANALNSALVEAGVEVRCLHEVNQITTSSVREVTGVGLADGRSIPAGNVIYSAHPGRLVEALPPGSVRPAYRNRLAGLDNTPPVFISYFRYSGIAPAAGRNHYFWPGKGMDGTGFAVMAATPEAGGACGARAIIELADAEDVAIALAERDGRRSREYRDWKERRSQELLQRASRHIPDLLDGAELLAASTPASYRDWTGTIAGSIYGPKRPARGIPLSIKTPLKGLFLTGQGLLSPGIMGAAASGIVAAGEVIGHQAVWEVLGFR